jgi:hypothetical protein
MEEDVVGLERAERAEESVDLIVHGGARVEEESGAAVQDADRARADRGLGEGLGAYFDVEAAERVEEQGDQRAVVHALAYPGAR